MNIKEKLQNALKDAMRSGDNLTKATVRMALSSIKLAEVEKGGALDDQKLMAIIQKEIKIRKDAIEDSKKAGRDDLIADNENEIIVLEKFLPEQLSDDKLREIVQTSISEAGALTMTDMGKVMKIALEKVSGQAPNAKVSQIVRELLSN
jgi:uncharacterized protein YqeY